MLTIYLKHGKKVIVVEKDNIAIKTTGNTTAKITYQHNLIYDYLINSYGKNYAKGYLQANKQAIKNIKNIIDTENIDCDFEYQPNYVYTTKQDDLTKINSEVQALYTLGESAEFVTETPLPFKVAGAIVNKNQAQFHPLKYIEGLVDCVVKDNALIFCNSTAEDLKKEKDIYLTRVNKFYVKSQNVIIATHYPFKKISRILFF